MGKLEDRLASAHVLEVLRSHTKDRFLLEGFLRQALDAASAVAGPRWLQRHRAAVRLAAKLLFFAASYAHPSGRTMGEEYSDVFLVRDLASAPPSPTPPLSLPASARAKLLMLALRFVGPYLWRRVRPAVQLVADRRLRT